MSGLTFCDSNRVDESRTNEFCDASRPTTALRQFPLRRTTSASETFSISCCTPGCIRRGGAVSEPMLAAARKMIANCHLHQVECRFFVSPLHADVLYAMYHLGLWPELENLKRGLAELAPTYDFTRYNHLIEERSGPVVYWPEAFHFSRALGELMARAMTGLRTADMPAEFRQRSRVQEISNRAWPRGAKSVTVWIAQHPDVWSECGKRKTTFAMAFPSRPSRTRK